MAIKPDFTFSEKDLLNTFTINSTAVAGTLLTRDTTDLSVVGVGACPYGAVVAGSVSVAGDRELGVLFYDVTATGVSFFDQVTNNLRYNSAQGQPCALWRPFSGMIFSTSQFLTSGTGSITAGLGSGNTAPDTLLGILNGQYVIASAFTAGTAGSVARAKLVGNDMVGTTQVIRVQVL